MIATDSTNLKMLNDSSSAFFGAFFAFIFGIVTYYWTKWIERQNKDYNSMVKLEGILNEHLNTFARDEFLIHGSVGSLEKGAMTYNSLRKYKIVEDLELSLLDLDLINQYFGYRDLIDGLNHDFETTNKANDILREVVLSNKSNQATITANSQIMIANLIAICKMAKSVDSDTKSLLCLIRIKIKKDQPGILGIKRLNWKPYKPTKQELKEEMEKLELESAETKEADAKRILSIMEK